MQDSREAPAVVLINATAAREVFGDESPLGRRFGFSPEERHELEIIGVVQDVKYRTARDAAGRDRALRAGLLQRDPAHERNRHSDGARRRDVQRGANGAQ